MTNVNFVYVHEMLQYKNIITFVYQRKNSFNRSITTCNIQERLEFCLVYSSSSLDAFCSFIIYMYVFNRRRFIHLPLTVT